MSAIQFEAVVEDNTIRIPEKYRTVLPKAKVYVAIWEEGTAVSKNAGAWQRFLQGIKACADHEPIEFERVNFNREVAL